VKEGSIPGDWKSSVVLPIYKGKGDPMECGSYREIKLLEHAMKVVEMISEYRFLSFLQTYVESKAEGLDEQLRKMKTQLDDLTRTNSELVVLLVVVIIYTCSTAHTHTHPFNSLFSRTTWVSRHQKDKTSQDSDEARDDDILGCSGISWTIYKQFALCSRQITSLLNFYMPDALPDAQPTVSRHRRH